MTDTPEQSQHPNAGRSPAEFRFPVDFHSGGAPGHGELILNHFEITAQMRLDGQELDDDLHVTKEYVQAVVKAVRATGQPKELVEKLTDAALYAKANECTMLFNTLGEDSGPRPTSPRPTASSITPTG